MMEKIIDLDDNDYPLAKGEKRISLFIDNHNQYEINDIQSKTAACDEALNFASKIEPQPGKRIILVSALGDFEHYEANKKGDAFPYNAILGMMPNCDHSIFSKYYNRLPKIWGLVTFVTRFNDAGFQIGGGNTFYEHNNRVPKDLLGKPVNMFDPRDPRCGFILASFWNPKMHRVEIIQEVWEQKLPQIVHQIDSGIMPGISMACDIPFDRCFECGNLAPSSRYYCEHLNYTLNPRNVIYKDSKAAIMINDFPVFFDSTITANPAAVEGRTLKKVANMENNLVEPETKTIYIQGDNSDGVIETTHYNDGINQYVVEKQRMRSFEPNLPPELIQYLSSNFNPFKSVAYLSLLGIIPKISEILQMFFNDFNPISNNIAEETETVLPKMIPNIVFGQDIPKIDYFEIPRFNPEEFLHIFDLVKSFMDSKSYLEPFFYSRPKILKTIHINMSYLPRPTLDHIKMASIKKELDLYLNSILNSSFVKTAHNTLAGININSSDINPQLYPVYYYEHLNKLISPSLYQYSVLQEVPKFRPEVFYNKT